MTWSVHDRTVEPRPAPCGDRLVKLRDVPYEVRKRETERLVARGLVDDETAQRLFLLLVDPGDAGGRVAFGAETR